MMTILLTQPFRTLFVEALIAFIVALIFGFLMAKPKKEDKPQGEKLKGALATGLFTLMFTVVLLLLMTIPFRNGQLPLHHLELSPGQFSADTASHLANTYLILEISVWTMMLAAIAGYFFNQGQGTFMLGVFAFLAAALCAGAAAVPFYPFNFPNTTWFLLVVIALIGVALAFAFSQLVLENKKTLLPLIVLWLEYAFSCWLGYYVAGRIGFLLITLPSQCLFVVFLYYTSIISLPIRNFESIPTFLNIFSFDDRETVDPPKFFGLFPSKENSQHKPAFRSLVTYNLGTNYPYYVIEDWRNRESLGQEKPEPRVTGNPFGEFFSGPGIVLNSCDHMAVSATGAAFTIHPPGLSFTEIFQTLYMDVDLRPQHRGMTIKAETKDGIPVTIFTFMPHRIGTGGKTVELGGSYPYDEEAVLKAVYNNATVEHDWRRENGKAIETVKEIPWHELVYLKGPAILKDIISRYTCDELHQTHDAQGNSRDPRSEIASEFSTRIREEMAPLGIEMVGGGISNIVVPEHVSEQRVTNWKAKWENKIAIEVGKAEAEMTQQFGEMQNQIQLDILGKLTGILEKAEHDHIRQDLLMRQLIEAMGLNVPQDVDTLQELLLRRAGVVGKSNGKSKESEGKK